MEVLLLKALVEVVFLAAALLVEFLLAEALLAEALLFVYFAISLLVKLFVGLL